MGLQTETKPKIEIETNVTPEGFGYQVSVWGLGKHGVAIKVYGEPKEGETEDAMAKRVNKFCVGKFREVEELFEQGED